MITKKSPEEIAKLRIAGGILAKMLKTLAKETVAGVSTLDLDDRAMELIEEYGVEAALLGYHPEFAATQRGRCGELRYVHWLRRNDC